MSGVRETSNSCLTPDTWHLTPFRSPTMHPFLRIGRRKFLRDSALGLGVAPLISGVLHPRVGARGAEAGRPGARLIGPDDAGHVRVKGPGMDRARAPRGFPGAVGVARVGARSSQPGACPGTGAGGRGRRGTAAVGPGILAFHRPRRGSSILKPTKSPMKPVPVKPSRIHLTGATPQAVLYAVFDFLERPGSVLWIGRRGLPAGAVAAL